jgi:hypothetical protein
MWLNLLVAPLPDWLQRINEGLTGCLSCQLLIRALSDVEIHIAPN